MVLVIPVVHYYFLVWAIVQCDIISFSYYSVEEHNYCIYWREIDAGDCFQGFGGLDANQRYNWLAVIQIGTQGVRMISPAASVASCLLVLG